MFLSNIKSNIIIAFILFILLIPATKSAYTQWNIINWSSDCSGEFFKIKFKTVDTGFVVGQTHGPGEGIIMRTTDAGQSWENLAPISGCLIYVDIHYPSNNLIYVLGGWAEPKDLPGALIYISEDHGDTWFPSVFFPTTSYSIHCLNKDSCLVAGMQNIYFADIVYLSYSIKWSFSDIGIDYGEIYSLHFYNDSCGYACGAYDDNSRGILLKTLNYGETWEVIFQPNEFSNFNTVYAISSDTIFIGGQHKIYLSYDGGQQWFINDLSKDLSVDHNRFENGVLGNNGVIRSIDFINDSVGFAVYGLEFEAINLGEIFKTVDSGTNWVKQDEWTQLNSVNFITDSIGYIAGDCMTILKTNNCGGGINVGIQEQIFTSKDVKIFPNPANNELIIDLTPFKDYFLANKEPLNIEIYNTYGQLFYNKKYEPSNLIIEINISYFPPGPYLITFKSINLRLFSKKVIVM